MGTQGRTAPIPPAILCIQQENSMSKHNLFVEPLFVCFTFRFHHTGHNRDTALVVFVVVLGFPPLLRIRQRMRLFRLSIAPESTIVHGGYSRQRIPKQVRRLLPTTTAATTTRSKVLSIPSRENENWYHRIFHCNVCVRK